MNQVGVGPGHQRFSWWAEAWPDPSNFQGTGRGSALPINVSEDGPRPGPDHNIFKLYGPSRPGSVDDIGLESESTRHFRRPARDNACYRLIPTIWRDPIPPDIFWCGLPIHATAASSTHSRFHNNTHEGERRCDFGSEDVPCLCLLHAVVSPAVPSGPNYSNNVSHLPLSRRQQAVSSIRSQRHQALDPIFEVGRRSGVEAGSRREVYRSAQANI